MGTRPAIFKWRQTESGLILCAVRWYLRYSLSLRDVEELLEERGLNVDHTTVWRWVQYYGPELEQRVRRHLKPEAVAERPLLFSVGDRGGVYRRQVGVDHSRLGMGAIAERLAKQPLGSIGVAQR